MHPIIPASLAAWRFLRRNPEYHADWQSQNDTTMTKNGLFPFPLHKQSHSDLPAGKWGLFAYVDPSAAYDVITPFWSITPMPETEIDQGSELPLLPMLRKAGTSVSGLLLLCGDLILKVERDNTSAQLRIKNGQSFDETCGLVLRLPMDLQIPAQLSRCLNIWNTAIGGSIKKDPEVVQLITMNSSSSLIAF
jgi:hypothetical protein